MVMGMPVAFAFGISASPSFYFIQTCIDDAGSTSAFSDTKLSSASQFHCSSSRQLTQRDGITERVMKLASVLTGHYACRDGTEQHGVSCIGWAGYEFRDCDAAMLSRVLGPGMIKRRILRGSRQPLLVAAH